LTTYADGSEMPPNAPEPPSTSRPPGGCVNVGGGATRRLLSSWSGDKDRGVAAPPTLKGY